MCLCILSVAIVFIVSKLQQHRAAERQVDLRDAQESEKENPKENTVRLFLWIYLPFCGPA